MLIHLKATTREAAIVEARNMIVGSVLQERANDVVHVFFLEGGLYYSVEYAGKADAFCVTGDKSKKNWSVLLGITKKVKG